MKFIKILKVSEHSAMYANRHVFEGNVFLTDTESTGRTGQAVFRICDPLKMYNLPFRSLVTEWYISVDEFQCVLSE